MDESATASHKKEILQTKVVNEYDSAGLKSDDERLQMVLNKDKLTAKMDPSLKLPNI